MRKDDTIEELRLKLQGFDAWNETHLSAGPNTARRVAKDRHVRFVNCACAGGHSGKVKGEEMTPYDWPAPGPKVP